MSAQADQQKVGANAKDNATEKYRVGKAFQLSIIGLSLAAMLVIVLILAGWKTASDITAVVGLFTSVLGTLVGAFFGMQIGSADKAKAEERAENAQKKVDALHAAADDKTLERAKQIYPDLFK